KTINVEKSVINWTGKKIASKHEGTLKFSNGAIIFKGDKLRGGNFTVDMNSINTTDLEGDRKNRLDGHLKNEDFFAVEKFPTSSLVFKKITSKKDGSYTVQADLTIKNITHPVTFDMVVKGNEATANLKFDRTKYDIKYGSGSFFDSLGDKAIL